MSNWEPFADFCEYMASHYHLFLYPASLVHLHSCISAEVEVLSGLRRLRTSFSFRMQMREAFGSVKSINSIAT